MSPPGVFATGVASLDEAVARRVAELRDADFVRRLHDRDPSIWVDDPDTPEITDRLGWLDVAAEMRRQVDDLREFADSLRDEFDRVVLCGMGGSSLAPEVTASTYGEKSGYPKLFVLDSTHPVAVRSAVEGAKPDRVLFVVSSKSGTTIETLSFFEYFWGVSGNGRQFVAVTDPGTQLADLGSARSFRRVFTNRSDIGGRFSALSYFGLVPAALIGADVAEIVEAAVASMRKCDDADVSPGLFLGTSLAEAARAGRNKLTLLIDPPFERLGVWIEQLVAESTGKGGQGIIPVIDEPRYEPDTYGEDRLFVHVSTGDGENRTFADSLRDTGQPVVELEAARSGLGDQFFVWEFATAVAGSVLRLNPFDQPNVAESKANTARVLEGRGRDLKIPDLNDDFLSRVTAGDYVALLAYLAPTRSTDAVLTRMRDDIRGATGAAATAAYGPRYLHSTGQLHKGGPPTCHFVVLSDEIADDIEIPGRDFGFADLLRAQAVGDIEALVSRGYDVVRADPGLAS